MLIKVESCFQANLFDFVSAYRLVMDYLGRGRGAAKKGKKVSNVVLRLNEKPKNLKFFGFLGYVNFKF
jgi:hypothetical protein